MQKLKQYWILILLVVLLIAAGFYWFQYRPYKARKDCAWKRMHEDAKAAVPQKGTPNTQAEIDTHNKSVNDCRVKYDNSHNICGNVVDSSGYIILGGIDLLTTTKTTYKGDVVYDPTMGSFVSSEVTPLRADYQPAQPAQPAKDWWGQTTPAEYEYCLTGKGF